MWPKLLGKIFCSVADHCPNETILVLKYFQIFLMRLFCSSDGLSLMCLHMSTYSQSQITTLNHVGTTKRDATVGEKGKTQRNREASTIKQELHTLHSSNFNRFYFRNYIQHLELGFNLRFLQSSAPFGAFRDTRSSGNQPMKPLIKTLFASRSPVNPAVWKHIQAAIKTI